jgi:cytochrome c peroxidase
MKYLPLLLITTIAYVSCSKDKVETFAGFVAPSHFPKPIYKFENNAITREKFELGRQLFYDPLISYDKTISCGSCHIQTSAFTHHSHTVSHGIFDQLGIRNAPAVMNLAWAPSFMWDGGITDLDLLPIAPITNHVEMGDTMSNVINKLNAHPEYPAKFKKAFGDGKINTANFLKALSQFMLMCTSTQSKFDDVVNGNATFTTDEEAGFTIFKSKCANCHKEPLFTDYSYRNNGLKPSNVNDIGRALVSLDNNEKYKFKVPSLRNVEHTKPYMHDGRYRTLQAAIQHYQSNVTDMETLDPLLKNDTKPGLLLTTSDITLLETFLLTLTDKSFLNNSLLSEQ